MFHLRALKITIRTIYNKFFWLPSSPKPCLLNDEDWMISKIFSTSAIQRSWRKEKNCITCRCGQKGPWTVSHSYLYLSKCACPMSQKDSVVFSPWIFVKLPSVYVECKLLETKCQFRQALVLGYLRKN